MLILVSDMHIRPGTPGEAEFLEFLSWVSTTSYDIAFLGDVFELWIALPEYEEPLNGKFLAWCAVEKSNRAVYFIDGNHEFFVSRYHCGAFSDSSPELLMLYDDTLCLAHGDGHAGVPIGHRFFRWFSRSWISWLLLTFLPGAHRLVSRIKRRFEEAGLRRAYEFPEGQLEQWGARMFVVEKPLHTIVIGHYHRAVEVDCNSKSAGGHLFVLPAWKDTGEIALYEPEQNTLFFREWRYFLTSDNNQNT